MRMGARMGMMTFTPLLFLFLVAPVSVHSSFFSPRARDLHVHHPGHIRFRIHDTHPPQGTDGPSVRPLPPRPLLGSEAVQVLEYRRHLRVRGGFSRRRESGT